MKPALTIFDCDGTLIDSELLYNTVISDLLCESGLDHYTPELCLERFTGLTLSTIRAQVEEEHKIDLETRITPDIYVSRAQAQMDKGLNAIVNADQLLARSRTLGKICVATLLMAVKIIFSPKYRCKMPNLRRIYSCMRPSEWMFCQKIVP